MALPVIPTDRNGTTYIAILFVFLAYVLHPRIEKTLERLRAYRAWRSIENGESVEVTKLSAINEIVRGRGTWDAARLTAILLVVFSLACWGLELRLDLENVTDGPVDMMDRPPPVVYRAGTTGAWEARSDLDFSADDKGFLGNFEGTLQTGSAITRFRVGSDTYKGSTLSVWWSDNYAEAHSSLSYDVYGNGTAVLNNLNCTTQNGGNLYVGEEAEERWGTALECGNGPTAITNTNGLSAPTILLQDDATGVIHLIVEEESNYPGFMYSVWTPVDETITATSINVMIRHSFHVASKARLAEAIVTGIVNGVETGGGCVDLLFQHSQLNEVYELDGKTRASPFGEHPGDTSAVSDLSDVEPIEKGVIMDDFASTCFVFVVIVSVLSIAISACVSSRVGIDVYDRDDLINELSDTPRGRGQTFTERMSAGLVKPWGQRPTFGGDKKAPPPMSEVRVFVHQDGSGKLQVTVQTTKDGGRNCSISSSAAVVDAHGGSSGGRPAPSPKWVRLEGRPVEPPPGHPPANQTRSSLPLPTLVRSSSPAASRLVPAAVKSVTRASLAERVVVLRPRPLPVKPPVVRHVRAASSHTRTKPKAQTSAGRSGAAGRRGPSLQKAKEKQKQSRPVPKAQISANGQGAGDRSGDGRPTALALPRYTIMNMPRVKIGRDKPSKPCTDPRPVTQIYACPSEPSVGSSSARASIDAWTAQASLRRPAKVTGQVSGPRAALSYFPAVIPSGFDQEASLGMTFGRPPAVASFAVVRADFDEEASLGVTFGRPPPAMVEPKPEV